MAISATAANPAKSTKSAEISKSTKPVYPLTLTPLIVQKLCAPIARKLGVKSLYLFGSVAQGTANRNSDVDFIYELQNESNLDGRTFVERFRDFPARPLPSFEPGRYQGNSA